MDIYVGCTYHIKHSMGYIVLHILDVMESQDTLKCEVRGGSAVDNGSIKLGDIHYITKSSLKSRRYNIKQVDEPLTKANLHDVDWYGKNVRINYKDKELLPIYIEMALMTKDFKWLKQLWKVQQGVNA